MNHYVASSIQVTLVNIKLKVICFHPTPAAEGNHQHSQIKWQQDQHPDLRQAHS